MRKLVTLRNVADIRPIEKADRIELAVVDGWTAIIKKGEFKIGDVGVFFEIDSFVPMADNRFEFLAGRGSKMVDGVERNRIKTQKMRGELSQGLLLPLNSFPEIVEYLVEHGDTITNAIEESIDFASLLNVTKFERPEPQAANASGNFPECLIKTDESRIQNIYRRLVNSGLEDVVYYPTLKLDGSSTTIAFIDNDQYADQYKSDEESVLDTNVVQDKTYHTIVCSRNLQLKNNEDSHFIRSLHNGDMINLIKLVGTYLGRSVAIQGECIGPGIQGNPEMLDTFQFFAFNIFDLDKQEYIPYSITKDIFSEFGIKSVPLVDEPFKPFERFNSLEELLAFSDGGSLNAKRREGIVYKSDEHGSFKVISNAWLLDPRNA